LKIVNFHSNNYMGYILTIIGYFYIEEKMLPIMAKGGDLNYSKSVLGIVDVKLLQHCHYIH